MNHSEHAALTDDGAQLPGSKRAARRPFWRYHPRGDSVAVSNVHFNALHIPGWDPTPGTDLNAPLPQLPLLQREWMIHELAHITSTLTAVGRWQKNLAYALQLTLAALPTLGMRLALPAWEVPDHPELTSVLQAAWRLLHDIDRQAQAIDEIIATFETLVFYRGKGVLTSPAGPRILRDIRARTPRPIYTRVNRLLKQPWCLHVDLDDPEQFAALISTVIRLAAYAQNPPPKVRAAWWHFQHIISQDSPLARFDAILHEISSIPTLEELDRFTTSSVFAQNERDHDIDENHAYEELLVRALLDDYIPSTRTPYFQPLMWVGQLLGYRPKTILFDTPLGRAIHYLHRGYMLRSVEQEVCILHRLMGGFPGVVPESWSAIVNRGEHEEQQLPDVGMMVPILAEDEAVYHVASVVSCTAPIGYTCDRFIKGTDQSARRHECPIVAPPIELCEAWCLELLLGQIAESPSSSGVIRIRCLCQHDCRPGDGCPCSRILSPIASRLMDEKGNRLTLPPCLLSSR